MCAPRRSACFVPTSTRCCLRCTHSPPCSSTVPRIAPCQPSTASVLPLHCHFIADAATVPVAKFPNHVSVVSSNAVALLEALPVCTRPGLLPLDLLDALGNCSL